MNGGYTSYYYNYFIGYIHEGKIYPLGPYTANGKRRDVVSRSRSFASDLHEDFYVIRDEMISDELRKDYEYETYEGEKEMPRLKYLRVSELPKESYIRKGYFLIRDVVLYEEGDGDSDELFYDRISPSVYAGMMKNEITFGKPADEYDAEGEKIERHSAGDYMYYAYPNYFSKEYEAEMLRVTAGMLDEYDLPKGSELVVIEDEG